MYRDEILVVWGTLLFCVVLISLPFILNPISCQKKFGVYGETSYSMIGGCMVYHKGRWIPSETIREI